ncbi:MAG: NAD(P)H-dependent oxidoreductase [Crocinitomicaceae bacterium]|nr:NAD(P)H-dependent oxidoreductase [Crocinitomicaceae bacterium]
MDIIAFGASNSKNSINKQLANFVANQFDADSIEMLDLNDYELPIYGIDKEKEIGVPQAAIAFYEKIQSGDLIIISLAEHNGSYTAVFKNLLDWMSRHEAKVFGNKKLFLLSTSPGGMGGKFVMDAALSRFPRHGAEIVGHFSLPSFSENFDTEKGIINNELKEKLAQIINSVK